MLEKLKKSVKENYKYWIVDFVSIFVFMVIASVLSSFFKDYLAIIFFSSGMIHGKLSKPLEKYLMSKIK